MKGIEQRLIDFYNENERLQSEITKLKQDQVRSDERFTVLLCAFVGVAVLFLGFSIWSMTW